MMLSQSVLVEASAFLLQLVPGGSLPKTKHKIMEYQMLPVQLDFAENDPDRKYKPYLRMAHQQMNTR